ncbi:hypothetical protein SteCoe_22943 [Stentor coeruleus]|uniref:IgGFc-binding protein N-terminal domain-containing protein n=1 Tax=Stentor coeruleus TaxID=5963 RepID=A0A1R2BL44_9CILI|nr:hypothetical protein SteCoe_22943 [Stentor coeruleus]
MKTILILLLSFYLASSSISVLKELNQNYLLDSDEYVTIQFYNYFSAPVLVYDISPKTSSMLLMNSSLSIGSSTTLNSVFPAPNFIELLQPVCQLDDNHCQKYIHASNDTLYYYDTINPSEKNPIIKFDGEILQYSLVRKFQKEFFIVIFKGENCIKMGTTSQVYNNTANSFDFSKINIIDIGEPFPLLQPYSVSLSKGSIINEIIVTGFSDDKWYIILISIQDDKNMIMISNVTISGDKFDPPMFCITIEYNHYVYIPNLKLVIEILSQNNIITVNNSLYINKNSLNVTSMQPSHNFTSLLLGTDCGFLALSLDFEKSYYQNVRNSSCSMYIYPYLNHNYFIGATDDGKLFLSITELDNIFTLLGVYELNLTTKNFSWIIDVDYDGDEYLIINNGNALEKKKINLVGAYMNFTCDDNDTNYTLTVYNKDNKDDMLVKSFRVTKLIDLKNIYTVEQDNQFLVSFYNLKGYVEVNLYNFFMGSNVLLKSCEISDINPEIDAEIYSLSTNKPICSNSQESPEELHSPESLCISNATTLDQFDLLNAKILTTSNLTYIYNSTGYFVYKSEMLSSYEKFINYSVIEMIQCGSGLFIVLEKEEDTFIQYSTNLDNFNFDYTINVSSCQNPQCSSKYFVCKNSTGLIVFSYDIINKPNLHMIYYLYVYENNAFKIYNDYALYDNYIAAIIDYQTLLLYDLENIPVGGNNSSYSMTLNEDAYKIYADSNYYYIISKDYDMWVYSNNLIYEKRINLGFFTDITIFESLVFAYDNEFLTIVNVSMPVVSSKVFTTSLKLFTSLGITNYNTQSVKLSYINNDTLFEQYLYLKCKAFNITFTIKSNSFSLSEIFYQANLSLNVINNFKQESQIITSISLFINGQSIYVNNNTIDYIQNNLMEVTCGSEEIIPLDEIFWGQNLSVSLSNNVTGVKINQRFSLINDDPFKNYTYSAFMPVKDLSIYIATNSCNVYIINEKLQVITSMELDDPSFKNCLCTDIGNLHQDNKSLMFVIGCQFKTYRNIPYVTTSQINMPENSLIFIQYENDMLYELEVFSMLYFPSSFKEVVTNDGDFMIATIDIYDDATDDSYYANHLQIVYGNISLSNICMVNLTINELQDYLVTRYYFADLDGLYDPNFDEFYFYLAEIYSGLIILTIPKDGIARITNVSLDSVAVATVRCGKELYVSFLNSTIYKYHLESWDKPVFYSTTFPYLSNFVVTPGSLWCSDPNYAKYLLFLMQQPDPTINSDTYLLVIDNSASELASTVTAYFLYNGLMGIYAYFYNLNTIVVVTPQSLSKYSLNDYVITIAPNNNCNSDRTVRFNLTACSDWVNNSDVSFLLKIKDNYSPGNVSFEDIPNWGWVLIALGMIIVTIVAVKISKKFWKCKSKRKNGMRQRLFNYDIIESEINK